MIEVQDKRSLKGELERLRGTVEMAYGNAIVYGLIGCACAGSELLLGEREFLFNGGLIFTFVCTYNISIASRGEGIIRGITKGLESRVLR